VLRAQCSVAALSHLLLLAALPGSLGRRPLATASEAAVTNKRKTKITFETERLFVISAPTSRAPKWCDRCGAHSQTVTAEDAAILANKSLSAIRRDVESEKLHSTGLEAGSLLICLNSILGLK
jgi:hypothetical protein